MRARKEERWKEHKDAIKSCANNFEEKKDTTQLHLWAETIKEAETYVAQEKKSPLTRKKIREAHEKELAPLVRAYNLAEKKFKASLNNYFIPQSSPNPARPNENPGASLLSQGPSRKEKSFEDYGKEEKNFFCCCKFFGKPKPKKTTADDYDLPYTPLVNQRPT
jgi:hypothetical protein